MPINQSVSSSSNRVNISPISEVFSSEPEIGSNELYIPENKPFLPVQKMHRISHISAKPQEECKYATHRFVKGGKWPPKTKFCTTSSMSKQPTTRADCAPLIEHSVNNTKDLDEVYQLGDYLTTWCSHGEEVLDDLV